MEMESLKALAAQCDYKATLLARAMGISPRHLQRLFAAQFGLGPQQWLHEQRLLAAKTMLGSARAVKEVAYQLGFPSAAQLSRDFRNYFGVRPSQLLQRNQE
ncbi:MAG TPA: helix-turn-helix domain-containing protein [Polyangiaceae bacterium]|jgi:AraC-like DNA-binding protein|nr:helix-turn-helix domain-containing protein [Polyangiaceae bacterium]